MNNTIWLNYSNSIRKPNYLSHPGHTIRAKTDDTKLWINALEYYNIL